MQAPCARRRRRVKSASWRRWRSVHWAFAALALLVALAGCSDQPTQVDVIKVAGVAPPASVERSLQRRMESVRREAGLSVRLFVFECRTENATPFFQIRKAADYFFDEVAGDALLLAVCPDLGLVTPRYSTTAEPLALYGGLSYSRNLLETQQAARSDVWSAAANYLALVESKVPEARESYIAQNVGVLTYAFDFFGVDEEDVKLSPLTDFIVSSVSDLASSPFWRYGSLAALVVVGLLVQSAIRIVAIIVLILVAAIAKALFKVAQSVLLPILSIAIEIFMVAYVKLAILSIVALMASGLLEHSWMLNEVLGRSAQAVAADVSALNLAIGGFSTPEIVMITLVITLGGVGFPFFGLNGLVASVGSLIVLAAASPQRQAELAQKNALVGWLIKDDQLSSQIGQQIGIYGVLLAAIAFTIATVFPPVFTLYVVVIALAGLAVGVTRCFRLAGREGAGRAGAIAALALAAVIGLLFLFNADREITLLAPNQIDSSTQRPTEGERRQRRQSERARSNQTITQQLQSELRRLGHYSGPIDGAWGPASRRAFDDYVRRRNGGRPVTDLKDALEKMRSIPTPGR